MVTWKFHVDKSTNIIYDMILGRDLLTTLGMDIKFFNNIIIGGESQYGSWSATMDEVIKYDFKSITDKTAKP